MFFISESKLFYLFVSTYIAIRFIDTSDIQYSARNTRSGNKIIVEKMSRFSERYLDNSSYRGKRVKRP